MDPAMPDPVQPDPVPADAVPSDPVPSEADTAPGVRRRRAVRRVRSATRHLVDSAEELAVAIGSVATESAGEALSETIVPAAAGLARRVRKGRPGFRRSHKELEPLPNLYRVHPEARLAPVRELGLITIPVEEVVGTAVEGPDQRGRDFKPLPAFRSPNWEARWQRLMRAADRLASLPPIDVLKTGEGYWVTDGHNRVAIAIENGQLDIDADVRVVMLPGQPAIRPAGPLAAVLVDSAGLQSTRRATRPRVPNKPPASAGEAPDAVPKPAPEPQRTRDAQPERAPGAVPEPPPDDAPGAQPEPSPDDASDLDRP
jgi:hypothetical protein